MVEFALTVPVLLLILFAVIQFGIVFSSNSVEVSAAAREGARTRGRPARTRRAP